MNKHSYSSMNNAKYNYITLVETIAKKKKGNIKILLHQKCNLNKKKKINLTRSIMDRAKGEKKKDKNPNFVHIRQPLYQFNPS